MLWSERGLATRYDVATVWQERTEKPIRTATMDCGHFLPEERPDLVAAELRSFLAETAL